MAIFGSTKWVAATTLTVDTNAYAAGDLIGAHSAGYLTFTNPGGSGRGTGLIHAIILKDLAKQSAAIDVLFFTSTLSNSTLTDNSALDVHDTDLGTYIGHVSITASDYTALSDNSAATVRNIGLPFAIGAGNDLYAVLVSRGTPTYAAGTDVSIAVGILQDVR